MSNAFKFLKLDYLTIKPFLTFKNMIIFLVLSFWVDYVGDFASLIILMVYSYMFSTYPFILSEKNNLDMLYSTLPISKKDIVIGRHLFAYSLNLFGGIFALFINIIITILYKKTFDFSGIAVTIITLYIFITILESIQYPIMFKLGYTKSKFMVYFPMIILGSFTTFAIKFLFNSESLKNLVNFISSNSYIFITLILLVWILTILISISLSYKFYKEK